ncbi:efflux RND transporter periplasmic adaptor subunit [Vibrio hippocampi]|uniref:Toluene efflux pump periplasmic linker protein TtgG n=1 Tax=Vibrio hippocampi TaxID=654686 RepID=A0ABN8DJ29_9VIBR|nr:efflux RND transporter periplasmic adaptor subunit [Vibrio hippocampi]CAH0527095.1 Toluene efflux pump periplasmic linker protein TtgG [Vibrio hippocampi]
MPQQSIMKAVSQRPWLISLFCMVLLSIWLGLGVLKAEEPQPQTVPSQAPLARVVYQNFTATQVDKQLDLYGRTATDRTATLGAEVAGKIVKLNIKKGDYVKVGQGIAQIDQGDLPLQVERANAMLNVRQQEYNASLSLKKRGLQGEVAYATAAANLAEAKAMLRSARLALANSTVLAPFSGIVDHLYIELGDFVAVGDPIAKAIDLKVLVIEADVSERHVQKLTPNQTANIRFSDGSSAKGVVRYISRVASTTTNTFPIEIAIDNPNQGIPAGISAEVELVIDTQAAIKVTPAMLALDEQGDLGVKTLVDDHIKFVPIQLVKAEQDGVWLTGLGQQVDIVILGQGFVRDGDRVEAISVAEANKISTAQHSTAQNATEQ